MKKIILILLTLFFILPQSNGQTVSKEVLQDIISSIPSSLEISFLMKDLGNPYQKNLLHQPKKVENYKTPFKQALNLGIFEADLGYIYIYGEENGIEHLKALKELNESLGVGDYFDFETIRFLSHQNDLDSLLSITNNNTEQVRQHLQDIGKTELAILTLTGGWLEALYLTCKVEQKSSSKLLKNRIGEQKIILEQFLLLLSFFDEDTNIKKFTNQLNKLQEVYEDVKISYEYEESDLTEDNILITEDSTTVGIEFNQKTLDKILKTTEKIRNKIIE